MPTCIHKPLMGAVCLFFSHLSFSQTVTETLTITGAGTWTVPADVYSVDVECWGGGGGGCSSAFLGSGGGGGGGGYAEKVVCVTPGQIISLSVGAGGAAGRPAANGGDTWFSSAATVKAAGGGGGIDPIGALTSSGGTANIGTVTHNGGGGAGCASLVVGGGGGGGAAGISGDGGNGTQATSSGGTGGAAGTGYPFTGGNTGIGGNGASNSVLSGNPGINYGGGGGGAASSTGGNPGGAGGQGILRLTYTPTPVSASISYPMTSYCSSDAAQTVTLTGTGAYTGGIYSSTSGLTINAATGEITPSSSTASTYTVAYSVILSSCTVQVATTDVTINASAVSYTASPNTPTLCEGDVLTLNGTGSTTYSWSDGISDGVAFTPSVGTHIYTITGSDAGCDATATYTVTVVSANASASNTGPYCTDGTIELSTSGSPIATYQWNGPNGFTSTAANPTLPASGNGGTYSVTVTDGGCLATTTTDVIVTSNSTPSNINVSAAPASICPGQSVTLTASANGATSWSWTGPGSFASAVQNPVVASAQAGSYILVASNACGSSAPVSTTVSVTSVSATITGTPSYCSDQAGTTLTASGGTSYQWNNPANSATASVILSAGTYTVTADNAGCTATASVTVTAIPAPTVGVSATPNTAVCQGTQVTLSGTGATSYTWNNGVVNGNAFTPTTGTTIYNVTGTVSGCTATASYTVTVNPSPVVTISASPDEVLCTGESITLTGNGATSYAWSGGIINGTAFVPTGTALYTVTGTAAGCNATATYMVTVSNNPTASAVAQNVSCNGLANGSITVSANGGYGSYTYAWQPSITASAYATGLSPDNYSITVTDQAGCTATTSANITEPEPLVVIFQNDSVRCYGESNGVIRAVAQGGTAPYYYSFMGEFNSTGIFENLTANAYVVYLSDNNGCQLAGQTTISQPQPLTLSVNPVDSIFLELGETRVVTVSANTSDAVLNWSPNIGLECTDCEHNRVSTKTSLTYTVSASLNGGGGACETTVQIPVKVIADYSIYIPTAFSPNNDGVNDEYEFFGNKKAIKFLDFKVFDRWGEKVYESHDVNFKWNGVYNSASLAPGVYSYTVNVTYVDGHFDTDYKGTISLLK